MEENKNTIEKLTKCAEELRDKIDDLREFGEVSEVLTSAVETQVKMIYREALAELLGVESGLITDEYIEIATIVTDEESDTMEFDKEGYRHLSDEEIVAELKPLLDRDMLLDEDIEIDDYPFEEEVEEGDRIENLFNELAKKEEEIYNSDMTPEEKEREFDYAYYRCRKVLSEVMEIDPELITDDDIDLIMHGQVAEYYEGDKLIMKRIPYSEEIVKTVFKDSILENKDIKLSEIKAVENVVPPEMIVPAENVPREVVTDKVLTTTPDLDRIESLFYSYHEKADKILNSQISDEEKDKLIDDLVSWGKTVIAEVLGVPAEDISENLLSFVIKGQNVDFKNGDSFVMKTIPYTEESVRLLYDVYNRSMVDHIRNILENESKGNELPPEDNSLKMGM